MKVAYQLRPSTNPAAAAALLVPGRRAEDVLRLVALLELPAVPPVHLVADGFLVKLPAPHDRPVAGVIRLRAIAADLLLPVDAELVPPLLPDEAEALVRQRGLLFLPGGRVLEFDPAEALPLHTLLRVGTVEQLDWQPLPEPTALAEQLTEIVLDMPVTLPPELLQAGGEGVGTETPELPDARLPSRVAGKALFTLGKGLAWLGNALHLPGLAGAGAGMLAGALALVPRLSEQLLNKQEAMLRHLLRQFREGKVEEALKRALPLMGDNARGAAAARDARLPQHQLFYSLLDLLGARGGSGSTSVWFLKRDIEQELLQEYRKQADLAAARGDFRRAAFIYGKLLNDFRAAALVLSRGGLHRDAALICEQVLKDLPLAAHEWEVAGEIDRALVLHLRLGDHTAAGDLLRRAGEAERAVEQYQLAAVKLVESGARHYEAGQLLETRASRLDLALPHYRNGWEGRPYGNPVPCLLRLAGHEATLGDSLALLELTDEADAFLEAWDAESASSFYNALARHAELPTLAPVAADLRDRARLGLARKLAQGGERRGGNYLATLFPAQSPWPVPLMHDAAQALRQARRRSEPSGAIQTRPRVRDSIVRAVCQLPQSAEVLLGLESGEVIIYRPNNDEVATIAQEDQAILSLVPCGLEGLVAVLSRNGAGWPLLAVWSLRHAQRRPHHQSIRMDGPAWLSTPIENHPCDLVGVQARGWCSVYRASDLVATLTSRPLNDREPAAVVLLPAQQGEPGLSALALHAGRADWYAQFQREGPPTCIALPWTLASEAGTLAQPRLCAVHHGALEIMGIDSNGGLRHTTLQLGSAVTPKTVSAWPPDDESFLAFAWVRANLWAGVTRTAVHWLSGGATKPAAPPTPIRTANPVAAFALPGANEVLIVEADCSLLRVAVRG